MADAWVVYYWTAFAVSLWALLRVPARRMNGFDNFAGSVLCAMFGFILWPLYVAAAVKVIRNG